MFGIDIGLNLGSVSLVSGDAKQVINCVVVKEGKKKYKDDFKRCVYMADGIMDAVFTLTKLARGTVIQPLVSIEEPVFVHRVRNPRSFYNLTCVYALVRNKLQTRGYHCIPIHPKTAKATAVRVFPTKPTNPIFYSNQGRGKTLNKKGMIRAYKKLFGSAPVYSNQLGRETLADSFFIAKSGIDMLATGTIKWKPATEY